MRAANGRFRPTRAGLHTRTHPRLRESEEDIPL
jgi:hypothetical protein